MEPRRRVGLALMAVGALATVVGVGGLVLDDDEETPAAPTSTSPTTTNSETISSTTTATTTGTAAPSAEDPATVVAEVLMAISAQDADYLVGRLAPATVDRYGLDRCRSYFSTVPDAAAGFEVDSVGPPKATWDYATDGLTVMVTDAIPVTIARAADGFEQELHLVSDASGTYLFFGDCGDPIEGAP